MRCCFFVAGCGCVFEGDFWGFLETRLLQILVLVAFNCVGVCGEWFDSEFVFLLVIWDGFGNLIGFYSEYKKYGDMNVFETCWRFCIIVE